MWNLSTVVPFRALVVATGLVALCGSLVGCGEDDCGGLGELVDAACVCDDGYRADAADPLMCVVDDGGPVQGMAVDVELNGAADAVKIQLDTMSVLGVAEGTFDLYLTTGDPVDGGLHLVLGDGVQARNLGNVTTFHDVSEAPETGYMADNPSGNLFVIGSKWRSSLGADTGTVGTEMTSNVFAVLRADGTYAKVAVLSADDDLLHVLCYWQPDGSVDISTTGGGD